MSAAVLPDAVRAFVERTNAGDTEGFVAAFTHDATLDDWGRRFHGHDGIRSWDRTDNIGVNAHFEVVDAVDGPAADEVTVTLKVTGDGYNGTGPMVFALRDGLIAGVTIS